MRGSKTFRLGRVRIDEDGMTFEEEGTLAFEAHAGDELSLGLAYDYREHDNGKETVRIRLVAELPGAATEHFETTIKDNPAMDDSRRGFVSLPLRGARVGSHKGRFRIEADYEAGAWTERAPDRRISMRHEGEFTLRVS